MKTLHLLTFIMFLRIATSCNLMTSSSSDAIAYANIKLQFQANDTILKDIQNKIYQSFINGLMSKDPSDMEAIDAKLKALYREHPQNIILYWQAYLQYYKAVYHIKHKDNENSKKEIMAGVEIMEGLSPKNSEDYALLAMLQGYAIQYLPNMKKGIYSTKTKKNIANAIKLDENNLRAHYVAASNDYYTPKEFGGGKIMEKHLLKAIDLPDQQHPNAFLPSWGKELSYAMLIEHYINEENKEEAKKYFKKAIEIYPESYSIRSLATKLIE